MPDGNVVYMRETLGQRIKRLRLARGFETQKALADVVGCKREAVAMWEGDRVTKIGGEYLPALAEALEVSPQLIQTGKDSGKVKVHAYAVRELANEADVDPNEGVLIPVSDMDVSGGPGQLIPEFVETRYKLHFSRSWLNQMHAKAEDIRIAKVRGESMQPTLWDGDKAVIHTTKTRIRNDKVFALAYAGEARVKRLYQLADGRLRIVSDNPDKARYPDEFIDADDMQHVLIIGQVIDKMGSGGL